MKYKSILLTVTSFLFIHSVIMFWMFHNNVLTLKMEASTTISMRKPLANRELLLDELDELWKEELINNMFEDGTIRERSFRVKSAGIKRAIQGNVASSWINGDPTSSDHLEKEEFEGEEIIDKSDIVITNANNNAEIDDSKEGTDFDNDSADDHAIKENRNDVVDQDNTSASDEGSDSNIMKINSSTVDTMIDASLINNQSDHPEATAFHDETESSNDEQSGESDSQNTNSAPSQEENEKTGMVLVLTESRHGSTWLMDLLSYPDTSVPVFEPLNTPFLKMYARSEEVRKEALDNGHDPAVYWDWRAVILARICLCDFYGGKIEKAKLSGINYGSIAGLGYKAKRFGSDYKETYYNSLSMCERNDSMIVPKTIRLYNITELSLLPELGCNDFKIIHLVRDPRAVLLSRMRVFHELYDGNKLLGEQQRSQEAFSEEYMRRAASDLCSHHLHSYQVGMNPPDWLKDRYKLVRYEDLAVDPDRWARDLLQFIGISYTEIYEQYVYNTTHINERGQADKGSYSVERESTEIVNSWRSKLIQSHWRTIEDECKDFMKIMAYKPDFYDN